MSLKAPKPFGGGIKYKAVTSLFSDNISSFKVGSLSFGSLVSASAVSKPIFEIKTTEENTKITTPLFSGSGKNVVSFGSLDASASPKSRDGGFADYSSTRGSGGFNFGSSKGVSELATLPEIKTDYFSGE